MKIKSQQDFWSGLMFTGLGVAFAWGAAAHEIGDAANMGPGYFPLVLAIVLIALGAFITFAALVVETEDGETVGGWAWRPLLFILPANFAFGVLVGGLPSLSIPPMGLVAAVYAVTFLASFAQGGAFRLKETAVLASVLAAAAYAGFVLVLKLPLPVWPAFITA